MNLITFWPEVFMHIKKFLFIYLLILVFGLLGLSYNSLHFITRSNTATAKVINHKEGKAKILYKLGSHYNVQTFHPVFSYFVEGKNHEYMAEYSCENGCHKLNSTVTVFYLKEKPETVLISTFEGLWKYQVYFIIFMAVLFFSALPYLFYKINKQPEF